jgi:hypothetical protein
MTPDEVGKRDSYKSRVEAIDKEVAANASEDDIARAFFAGEVWRLETKSDIARREFGTLTGLTAGATAKEESAASRTGPGINEEVVAGTHYRFLNLGNERPEPKPEHVAYFRGIRTSRIDVDPAVRVRFVGHASTPGTESYNKQLSRAMR